jgi:hypothetical protein
MMVLHADLQLPTSFRLGLEWDAAVAAAHRDYAVELRKLGHEIEIHVQDLLASAALRHGGAPYEAQRHLAVEKEAALWSGWLATQPDTGLHPGRMMVQPWMRGHSGRLVELSSSLGEAIALHVAEHVFKAPHALWSRIPETGAQKMDFQADAPGLGSPPTAGRIIAIEAKSGHGYAVGQVKKDIEKQKAGNTEATEKYGFVLCYEANRPKDPLSKKGSYVKIVDPPVESNRAADPLRAILRHYYQITQVIGPVPLRRLLGLRLGIEGDGIGDLRKEEDQLAREVEKILQRPAVTARVDSDAYTGFVFGAGRLPTGSAQRGLTQRSPNVARGLAFMGLPHRVVKALLGGHEADMHKLLEFTANGSLRVEPRIEAEGTQGAIYWTVLSDGVLRADFSGDPTKAVKLDLHTNDSRRL